MFWKVCLVVISRAERMGRNLEARSPAQRLVLGSSLERMSLH